MEGSNLGWPMTKTKELQCVAKASSWHTTGSTTREIDFAPKDEEWSSTTSDRMTEWYSALFQRVHNAFSPLFDSLPIESDKLLLQLVKFFCANHLIFHHPPSNHSIGCQSGLSPPHGPTGNNAEQPHLNAERLRSAKVRQSLPLQSSSLDQLESPCGSHHTTRCGNQSCFSQYKLMGLQTTDWCWQT